MNPNIPRQAELPIIADNEWLLGQLDELANDPHGSLIAMTNALGGKVSLWLVGLPEDDVRDDPETVKALALDARQYELIKSFEEVVKVVCLHGDMNPAQFGEWLSDDSMKELHFKQPIGILFHDFSHEGFSRDAVSLFASAVRPHMQVPDNEYDGLWAKWLD
jgi:hypothetical protein